MFIFKMKPHAHDWKEEGNRLVCECGKHKLKLTKTNVEGILTGTRNDGSSYSVREDRHRYFFPEEWIRFHNALKPSKQILFESLIQTGARIEEALNIREDDFDFSRNTLTLRVTKIRATKGEQYSKKRTFVVSSGFIRHIKKYISENNISKRGLLFSGKGKKSTLTKQGVSQMFKRTLKKAGIVDYYNFSLHNTRKTHGMWLKTLIPYSREITEGEICSRLGHDMTVYLKYYTSPSIFNERDKNMIIKLLGDIYGLK